MKEMGVKVGGQMVIRQLLAEVCVWLCHYVCVCVLKDSKLVVLNTV